MAFGTITGNHIVGGSITTNHISSDFGAMLDLSSNDSIRLRVQEELDGVARLTDLEGFVTDDDLITQVGTVFDQRADGFMLTVTGLVNDEVGRVSDDINEYKNAISMWQRFDTDGFSIGKRNSPYSINITESAINFLENDVPVAWVANNQLRIASSQLTNTLVIGNEEEGYMTLDVVEGEPVDGEPQGALICTWSLAL